MNGGRRRVRCRPAAETLVGQHPVKASDEPCCVPRGQLIGATGQRFSVPTALGRLRSTGRSNATSESRRCHRTPPIVIACHVLLFRVHRLSNPSPWGDPQTGTSPNLARIARHREPNAPIVVGTSSQIVTHPAAELALHTSLARGCKAARSASDWRYRSGAEQLNSDAATRTVHRPLKMMRRDGSEPRRCRPPESP